MAEISPALLARALDALNRKQPEGTFNDGVAHYSAIPQLRDGFTGSIAAQPGMDGGVANYQAIPQLRNGFQGPISQQPGMDPLIATQRPHQGAPPLALLRQYLGL